MPASICGAAIQLPDDDDKQTSAVARHDMGEVVQDSIELLLTQRRCTMAEFHDSLIPKLMKLRL
jgi:hypothetical protein